MMNVLWKLQQVMLSGVFRLNGFPLLLRNNHIIFKEQTMKRHFSIFPLLCMLLLISVCPVRIFGGDGMIQFGKYFKSIYTRAKSDNMPILMYIGRPGWAQRPLQFTDDKVVKLSEKFICVHIDPRVNQKMAVQHGVTSSSKRVVVFLDGDGSTLETLSFPKQAGSLYGTMNRILEKYKTRETDDKKKKARAEDEEKAKILWESATTKEDNRKYGQALSIFKQVAKEYPNTTYGILAKDKLKDIQRNPVYKESLDRTTGNKQSKKLYSLARTYFANKRYEKAKEYADKIVTDYPDSKYGPQAAKLLREIKEKLSEAEE